MGDVPQTTDRMFHGVRQSDAGGVDDHAADGAGETDLGPLFVGALTSIQAHDVVGDERNCIQGERIGERLCIIGGERLDAVT